MPAPSPSLPACLQEAGRRALITCQVDARAWPTRVTADSSNEFIEVFAPRDYDGPVKRYPGALLTIEIPTDQALYRLPATLIEEITTTSPVWRLGEFRDIEKLQRRTANRFRGYFDAALAIRPDGRTAEECPLPRDLPRNLSTTGCYLQTTSLVPPGAPVQVRLHLEPRHVWTLDGEVIRTESPKPRVTGVGIHFHAPDREAQRAIQRYIMAAERLPQSASLIG